MAPPFLRFQIIFFEQRRLEEVSNTDLQSLAYFVNDPQFYGIIGTMDDVVDGRFGYAGFGKQLILGHTAFLQQLAQSFADGLIQFHRDHLICTNIRINYM